MQTSFSHGLPVQLEGGGDAGNRQDAAGTLILSTGAGKWANSYVRTRSSAYSWRDADGAVVYAARLKGIASPADDWQIQLFVVGNQGEALDAPAPAYVFANTMGLVLKPAPDGQGVVARFAAKLGLPRASLDQKFLEVGEPVSAQGWDIPVGFRVDKHSALITYFAGNAQAQTALTPEMDKAFAEGTAVFLALVNGASARKVSAEFSDLSVAQGTVADVPASGAAPRLRADGAAQATARVMTAAVVPIVPLSEDFKGEGVPEHFVAGGNPGSRQRFGEALVLTSTAHNWSNSYLRTKDADFSWRGRGQPVTYAFLPLSLSADSGEKAALRFFLIGNPPDNPDVAAPTYLHPNVLGLTVQPSPEGGYAVKCFAKANRPRAEFNLDWMQLGKTLRIPTLGVPVGFTLNEAENSVAIFAGDQRTAATLKADVLPAFEKAMVFVNVMAGNSGLAAEGKVAGVRVFSAAVPPPSFATTPAQGKATAVAAAIPARETPEKTPQSLTEFFKGSAKPGTIDLSSKASVSKGLLVLATGTEHWSRAWASTRGNLFTFAKGGEAMTFAFYPDRLDGDALVAALKFFLVGNQTQFKSPGPDYSSPNLLGICMTSNSSGLGWNIGLYAKINQPDAGYEKPWFAVGKPLTVESMEGPIGFSVDPRTQKVTLFAQAQSAQHALPAKAFSAFDQNGKVFILLNTGTAKLETTAYVKGFEIYPGRFRGAAKTDKQ